MKTLSSLLGQNLRISYMALIGIFCFPCLVFGVEPIGTIGKPPPEYHAFLSNETFLRVVTTHIQVVDLHTNAVIDEFGERTEYSDVVLSPTVTHIALLNHAATQPRTTTITIWDINTREQIMEWQFGSLVMFAAFSPTAPVLAIYFKADIDLWNWQTGEHIATITRADLPALDAIVFSADGRHLIVASARPDIEWWDVEMLRFDGHFDGRIRDRIEEILISPDGAFIATFDRNSTSVYVWDVGTQRLLWRQTNGTDSISSMVFSPDSQRLYVTTRTSRLSKSGYNPWVGWDDQVRVWDINAGQQINVFGTEFRGLKAVTLSPNEKIAILYYTDAVVLWDLEKKQSLRVWADFLMWSTDIQLSPDGKQVVAMGSSFASGLIKTWDVASQQLRHLITAPQGEMFGTFAISPDSRKLAVAQDPWIQVHDLRTGKVKTQFTHRVGFSRKIVFSASGRWIAVVDDWDDLFIFDLKNPKELQKIEHEEINFYNQYIFSKNDEYLAAVGRVREGLHWISVWKRERGTFVFQYKWQMPELDYSWQATLAFATNTVLAAASQGTIHIWKLLPNRPQLLKTLEGGAPLHFSADTRYLFANRNDKLRIWDWREETPMDYPSIPASFAVSRDGSVLLSQTDRGQIQIWDAKTFLPSEYCPIVPHGKQLVILGEVKHNQLLQNFPNPFNPETWIPFRLADESSVTIQIYNPTGQLVRRLSPGTLPAGDYSSQSQAVYWDGRNQTGEPVSSGIYLYTIQAGDFSATRKMLIRK